MFAPWKGRRNGDSRVSGRASAGEPLRPPGSGATTERAENPAPLDLWGLSLTLVREAQQDIQESDAAMTPDQKLAMAQIYATLSVAQELTTDETTTPRPGGF
jgi:hypothetical protein